MQAKKKLGASQVVELGYRRGQPALGARASGGTDWTTLGVGLILTGVGVGAAFKELPAGFEEAPAIASLGGGILLVLHGIGLI